VKVSVLILAFIAFCFLGLPFTIVGQCPCPPSPTPTPTPTPTPSPSPMPEPAGECLNRTGPLVVLSNSRMPYSNTSLASNTRIDARQVDWSGQATKAFNIGGGANVCATGVSITGTYSLSTSWDTMHDQYAIQIRGPSYLVEAPSVENYGDGIWINSGGDNFTVRGAYLRQIRDDAISNDYGRAGVIDDSLIDGTYVGLSDRGQGTGPNDAVTTLRNSLVRLQRFEQTYNSGEAGHGWFWKWDSTGVKLALHGNIFFAEAPSIHGSHQFPASKVVSCKKPDGSPDNLIIWGGSGSYPRPEELQSGCFTLTTDVSVWHNARAQWLATHGR
jgi:hypothetical protein